MSTIGSLDLDPPLIGSQKHMGPIGRKVTKKTVSLPPGLEGLVDPTPPNDITVLPLSDFVPDVLGPPPRQGLERWSSAPPSVAPTRNPWPQANSREPMYVTIQENTEENDEHVANKREIPGGVDEDACLDSLGDDSVDVYRGVAFSGYPMFDTTPSVGLPPAPGFHGLGGVTAPAPMGPDYFMGFPCPGAEDPAWPLWQAGMAPMPGLDGMAPEMRSWGSPCAPAALGGELPWGYPYAAAHPGKTQPQPCKALNGSVGASLDDGEKIQTVQRAATSPENEDTRPTEDALDDNGVKPVGLSRMPSVRPNTLEVEGHRVCWWPDCKKLEVRGQKHIVSPALYFDAEGKALMLADDGTIENLPADGESKCVKFIIMIQAKKVAPGRGGESFVKAKGRARFEVKCEEPCTATFLLSVGGARPEGVPEEGAPRGDEPRGTETPVTHDFGETPVYVFQDEWDLQPLKANLVVSLEIQALQR